MDSLASFADPPEQRSAAAAPLKVSDCPKFPKALLGELSVFAYKPPQDEIKTVLGSLPTPRKEASGAGKPARH